LTWRISSEIKKRRRKMGEEVRAEAALNRKPSDRAGTAGFSDLVSSIAVGVISRRKRVTEKTTLSQV
jgi:hypothetical protein